MTITLQSLLSAREGAEYALADAKRCEREASERLRRFGLELFKATLAANGITEGSAIAIEGQHSGGWADKVRSMKHDKTPVILRSVSVDSLPWTTPPPNSSSKWWWFRVTIARMKKDGAPRDEYRNFVVHGDTPEDAAQKIVKGQANADPT